MSATTTLERTDLSLSLPADLDAARSKLVYLYLAATGGATVEEIQDDLDMRKLSLFPVLDDLSDSDFVERDGPEFQPA